jgi:rhodanese-related sulfurtransferase
MATAERVSTHDVWDHVQSGEALFVCAYESDEKFQQNHLAGAIPLSEFKEKLDEIPKDQELIFY